MGLIDKARLHRLALETELTKILNLYSLNLKKYEFTSDRENRYINVFYYMEPFARNPIKEAKIIFRGLDETINNETIKETARRLNNYLQENSYIPWTLS
ncbi:hypothetical protein J4440_05305 [Candidatus Woesearchaeota archaeon]|nr:hypothetical protein [Candidatus Woesearchaeota archaeon]